MVLLGVKEFLQDDLKTFNPWPLSCIENMSTLKHASTVQTYKFFGNCLKKRKDLKQFRVQLSTFENFPKNFEIFAKMEILTKNPKFAKKINVWYIVDILVKKEPSFKKYNFPFAKSYLSAN